MHRKSLEANQIGTASSHILVPRVYTQRSLSVKFTAGEKSCSGQLLTPISIKNNPFLKLILPEQTSLLTCFGYVTRQKWLVSRRININKALFLIDVGVKLWVAGGRQAGRGPVFSGCFTLNARGWSERVREGARARERDQARERQRERERERARDRETESERARETARARERKRERERARERERESVRERARERP